MVVSNNEEKYFSRVHQSETSRNIFTSCRLKLFYSEIRTERRSTQQSVSNSIYLLVSPMEISRNPSKYLPMMLLFIHRHYVLNYPIFYDQWALSPQSVSAIYTHFVMTVARSRKFACANHILYD